MSPGADRLRVVEPIVVLAAVVVGVHVAVFAAVPALDRERRRAFRRRLRVAVTPVAAAWTLALCSAVALAAVLGPPFDADWSRGRIRVVSLYGLVLVGALTLGVTGLARAGLLLRRVRRTASGSQTPPGFVSLTGTAERLPTSGDGADETETSHPRGDPPKTPVFGHPALCWQWTVELDRPSTDNPLARALGTDTEIVTVETGGVPFQVATSAGPVRVDPDAVEFRPDRAREAVTRRPFGAPPPGELSESDVGNFGLPMADPEDTAATNVFREGHVEPGDAVTLVGDVAESGRLESGGRVVACDRDTVASRLRSLAVRDAVFGGFLFAVALPSYLRWLGLCVRLAGLGEPC